MGINLYNYFLPNELTLLQYGVTQDINRVIEHSITNYAYFSMFNFIQINFQNFLGSTVIVSPSIQQKISDELMMQNVLGFTPALFL